MLCKANILFYHKLCVLLMVICKLRVDMSTSKKQRTNSMKQDRSVSSFTYIYSKKSDAML